MATKQTRIECADRPSLRPSDHNPRVTAVVSPLSREFSWKNHAVVSHPPPFYPVPGSIKGYGRWSRKNVVCEGQYRLRAP